VVCMERIFFIPIILYRDRFHSLCGQLFERQDPAQWGFGLSYYTIIRESIDGLYVLKGSKLEEYCRWFPILGDLVSRVVLVTFKNFWFSDPAINSAFNLQKEWLFGVIMVELSENIPVDGVDVRAVLDSIIQPQYITQTLLLSILRDTLTLYFREDDSFLEKSIAGIVRLCMLVDPPEDDSLIDSIVIYALSTRETIDFVDKLVRSISRNTLPAIGRDTLFGLGMRYIPLGLCILGEEQSISKLKGEIIDIMVLITLLHFVIYVIDSELTKRETEVSDPKRLSIEDYEHISRLRKEAIALNRYIYEADAFNSFIMYDAFYRIFRNMGLERYFKDVVVRLFRVDDVIKSVIDLRTENIQADLLEEMQRAYIQDKLVASNLETLNYLIAAAFIIEFVNAILTTDVVTAALGSLSFFPRLIVMIAIYSLSWFLVFYLINLYVKRKTKRVTFGRIVRFFPTDLKGSMPRLIDAIFDIGEHGTRFFASPNIINYTESQELATISFQYVSRADERNNVQVTIRYNKQNNTVYMLIFELESSDKQQLYEEYRRFIRTMREYYDYWVQLEGGNIGWKSAGGTE